MPMWKTEGAKRIGSSAGFCAGLVVVSGLWGNDGNRGVELRHSVVQEVSLAHQKPVVDKTPSEGAERTSPTSPASESTAMNKTTDTPELGCDALVSQLRASLTELLEAQDAECRWDHNGYCQAHNLDHMIDGCRVARARELLANVQVSQNRGAKGVASE